MVIRTTDISDNDLLQCLKRGFIPGPKEHAHTFFNRVKYCEHIQSKPLNEIVDKKYIKADDPIYWHDWQLPNRRLQETYGISVDWISAFYSSMSIFKGGTTWIFETQKTKVVFPIVLARKKWVGLAESLSHEAVHAIRVAFEEDSYEEFFAYLTSKNSFRRIFGPLVKNIKEAFFASGCFVVGTWSYYLFDSLLPLTCSLGIISYGLFRLFFVRYKIHKLYGMLHNHFKEKRDVFAFLLCLTDDEIRYFSVCDYATIMSVVNTRKNMSLRWRLLYLLLKNGVQ